MEVTIVIIFLMVALGSTILGGKLVWSVFRQPKDPAIPTARDANQRKRDRVAGKVSRGLVTISKAVTFVCGGVLIAWPWALYYAVSQFRHESFTKGRVLRIRSRARLPQLSIGTGWCDDTVVISTRLSDAERTALGELWLLTARMEHASIAAFSQLSLQLSALGAPARLLEWSHRAALEEIGHAKRCFAVASAITGTAHRAGPIDELAAASTGAIDLTRLAIGSLIDGCLAEGMAADVAARGASTAIEPAIRATLELIAREESGHAELAWAVLEWCLVEGGAKVEAAVAARVDALSNELSPRLPDIPGIADATLAHHGVVGQDALGELAVARCRRVQDRAAALLLPVRRAA